MVCFVSHESLAPKIRSDPPWGLEMRIKRAALRWIGDDERMLSSIRTKLGQEGKGTLIFEHIVTYYVEPMVGDAREAERKFLEFDYGSMFGGNKENMHEYMYCEKLINILNHLSVSRHRYPAEWVQHLSERVPPELNTEYDRYWRTLDSRQQRMACEDITAVALYLGKALTRLRKRTPERTPVVPVPAGMFAHQHQGGARHQGPNLKKLPDVI